MSPDPESNSLRLKESPDVRSYTIKKWFMDSDVIPDRAKIAMMLDFNSKRFAGVSNLRWPVGHHQLARPVFVLIGPQVTKASLLQGPP
jgi:hypothetical protein